MMFKYGYIKSIPNQLQLLTEFLKQVFQPVTVIIIIIAYDLLNLQLNIIHNRNFPITVQEQ